VLCLMPVPCSGRYATPENVGCLLWWSTPKEWQLCWPGHVLYQGACRCFSFWLALLLALPSSCASPPRYSAGNCLRRLLVPPAVGILCCAVQQVYLQRAAGHRDRNQKLTAVCNPHFLMEFASRHFGGPSLVLANRVGDLRSSGLRSLLCCSMNPQHGRLSLLIPWPVSPVFAPASCSAADAVRSPVGPGWPGFQNVYDDWGHLTLYLLYFFYGYLFCCAAGFLLVLEQAEGRSSALLFPVMASVCVVRCSSPSMPPSGYSMAFILVSAFLVVLTADAVLAALALARRCPRSD